MPGFVALFGRDPDVALGLEAATAALSRRPGDRSGTDHCAEVPLHLGWIERAQSVAGVRPCRNATGDVSLWLYGELFGDAASCPEDAIGLYERHGDAFVAKLNGWFAGLLVDRRRDRALLFNDRYGVGRVHLRQSALGLGIATEPAPLLLGPSRRRVSAQALAESFALGCVLRDRTIFEGVSLLPAGSLWVLEPDGTAKRGAWFDLRSWEEQSPLPDDVFAERMRDTFSSVLPAYVNSADIGMSLTGGLDGRMIMAWSGVAPGSLPCYSFGGPFRDCHDARIAAEVAASCGQPHRILRVDDTMLREFPALARECVRVSGGTMDVSGAVELYVNRAAREIAPVRLTGNYGSEIVRGHVAFRPQRLRADFYEPEFARHLAAAAQAYADERRVRDQTFIAFKQVPWYHHARASVERSQLDVRSPFLDNALVELMYRASPRALRDPSACLELIRSGRADLARIATDRGLRHGQPGWRDRARRAVLDFSAKAEYAYDYGMPTWLTRVDRALSLLRPERLFLGRHKFYHFRTWYRRQLADYVQDTLLSATAKARAPYRAGVIDAMVREHVRGEGNHTDEIHRALTHELIQQTFIDPGFAGATTPSAARLRGWAAQPASP